jgi:tRNA-specific 2-thiouridylase
MNAVPARVTMGKDGRARVDLTRPVRAVAPGQAAVFFKETPEGEELLGGGWIARG